MSLRLLARVWLPASLLWLAAGPAAAVNVDFNDLAAGTSWSVGTTHTSQGVDVVGEDYFFSNGSSFSSGNAGVEALGFIDGTNIVFVGNINLRFDFGSVSGISLDYDYGGGNMNLRVNGSLANITSDLSALDGTMLGGASITATSSFLSVTGAITDFAIGGQELAIDNVQSVPEPALAVLAGVVALGLAARRERR